MPSRRGHGEDTVFQLPDGRWRGQMTVHHPDGRVTRPVREGATRAIVLRRLAELRRGLEAGRPPAPTPRMTVGQLLDRWLAAAAARVAATTADAYRLDAVRIRRHLGGIRLEALRTTDADALVAKLSAERYAPATVRATLGTLRRALRAGIAWELVARNVADYARPPRVSPRPPTVFSTAQMPAFLDAAAAADDPYAPLWTLMLTTGLRLGEALGLRWADVDLEGAVLTVRVQLRRARAGAPAALGDPKGRRSRIVPLVPRAVAALRGRRAEQAEHRLLMGADWADSLGLVFTQTTGHPLVHRTVGRAFSRALARAGAAGLRLHDQRHSAATHMLAVGVPLHVVSDVLGHSSVRITGDIYGHVLEDGRRLAAARMADVVGELPERFATGDATVTAPPPPTQIRNERPRGR